VSGPVALQLLGPSVGGIRRHVAYLRDELRDAGWQVRTAGPAGVLDDLDHVVPIPSGIRSGSVLAARRALAPLLDGVDVLHAHGLKAGWLAATVRRRPPLVVSIHNLVLDDVAGRSAALLRLLEERLPGRADATIAVSSEVARRFAGRAGAERIRVIPPAGPPPAPSRSAEAVRAELGVGPTQDFVVTAARLNPQKGLHVLLDAAASVLARRPGLQWFVFGEGALRGELEGAIGRLGLEGVVHLAGPRPDVDSELAAADLVVVTSQWESGPLVVLEALALGRPVVSTDVGLVPEVIDPASGRVVAVGDATGLAEAVVAVLSGATATGDGVPTSSARFRPETLAAAVRDVYEEVVSPR
jgi:glycosyltransferase involved in cell wall biosynthesis